MTLEGIGLQIKECFPPARTTDQPFVARGSKCGVFATANRERPAVGQADFVKLCEETLPPGHGRTTKLNRFEQRGNEVAR